MIDRLGASGVTRRPRRDVVRRTRQVAIPSRYLSQGRVMRGSMKRGLARLAPGLDNRMGMDHYNRMLRRARRNALGL